MKKKLLLSLSVPLFLYPALGVRGQTAQLAQVPAAAEQLINASEVAFSQLPVAVQNTIRSQLGNVNAPVVEMFNGNGQTSFVVPARVNRDLVDLWLDRAGNILALSPPRALLSSPTRLSPNQLPGPVQDTLRTYAQGAPVISVSKGNVQDRPVYDVVFNRGAGNADLRIAEDGSLVRDAVNDRFLAQIGRMSRVGLAENAPARVPLSNSVPISFNQLPLAVLSTVQSYAGTDYIDRLERGVAQGRTVYEASFSRNGRTVPLRISEEGVLVHDRPNEAFLSQLEPRLNNTGVGQPPASQTGVGTGGTFPAAPR